MADVILFRPRLSEVALRAPTPQPPLGLLFVAAPLIENNYKVKIIDKQISPYWLEELNEELNDSTICVGISSMTGSPILGGLEFAKIVKDRFDIPVVWGGIHPSMLPEQTIKNNLVDIVVRGEGEEAFLKIVTALKHGNSLKGIANVWWKENGRVHSNPEDRFIDLNDLPPLPYHLLDYEKYINVKRSHLSNCKRILDVHTDRGCPHRCGFCYNINVNHCRWRGLTASRAIEQIEHLVKKISLDGIEFLGDNFFVNKRRVVEICTEIIRRKIKIAWHADCRMDYFAGYDNSFIDLLRASGCESLTFGVESGSQRILDLIHKDITLEEIFKVNEKVKKMQLRVGYHVMTGFPGEAKEDILQTYRLMLRLYDEYPKVNFLGPSIYTPYPGTPLHYKCLEMGFKPPEKLQEWAKFDWYKNPYLPFEKPDYSRKWLMESSKIARRICLPGFLGKWYRMRLRFIVRFKIVGPQPEEWLIRLIRFSKATAVFVKKLLKVK